jgi:hypothetical protein
MQRVRRLRRVRRLQRVHRLATSAWCAVACGAGLGFIARDLLGLPTGLVGLAWAAGALAGIVLTFRAGT